jgi:hypothetical protein
VVGVSSQRSVRLILALGIALVAFTTIVFAMSHWFTVYDDTLIYLRYVRNLRDGCGLSFNCGDPAVEGFTSPLFLALLWAGSFATNHLIALAQIISGVCVVIAGGLAIATAAVIARDDARPAPALVAATATAIALALDPFVLLNANIAMDSAVAAAAVALVAFAAVSQRPRLLVAACVLAMLARPEGVLFVVALPLVVRDRRLIAVAVLAVLALTVVRLLVFGQPLPNTYYAKSGGTWRHAELGVSYIWQCVVDFPVCVLAVLAWRGRFVWIVALVWLAFFLRSGGDTFEYSRLWFPLVPALAGLAFGGVVRVRRFGMPAAAALSLAVSARAMSEHYIPPQGSSDRLIEWMAVGDFVRTHYPKQTLVATVPIGAIGFYSNRPILDLVGLTDRTIARSGNGVPRELLTRTWIGHERNDTAYVLARAPQLIVMTAHRDHPWTLAEARAGFWADYELLRAIKAGQAPYHVIDAEVRPGDHVLMFERDASAPAPAH